ncbi:MULTISPECIES: DUF11 domain-containing protein [Nocardioides]|uniref:DUF11 domain-containing protein n=1 Tax=Nocardioides vastitatis TaxID=2568655 RepID=A0ABW0ZM30_9ACTN|nr:DUF11 domain-containing protein [Nocardioides sp.]THJ09978.1 DUF11 domain-containing protein [Nocardioides sp.]
MTTAVSLVAGLLASFALLVAPVPQAAAVPGQPGTPSDPAVLYTEDFQNRPANSNILLSEYTGATGMTYTGDPFWVSRANCNGLIIQHTSPRQAGDCDGTGPGTGAGNYNLLTALPWVLAELGGFSDRTQNAAASSYTAGSSGDNEVQFRTTQPLSLPAANRFVTFSVDAAAQNCFSTHPELRFYLTTAGGQEIPVSAAAIDPCTDPRASSVQAPTANGTPAGEVRYGRFAADSSLLVSGNTLGIVMRNENGFGGGNDGAYDNIRVLDVTPQLDKAFSPTSVPVGEASTLTLTVTNTSELAAKSGWGFTDTLPDGLVVASPANLGGTCQATRTAEEGSSTIAITNGVLNAGQASCTITVDVTSDSPRGAEPSPKTYTNCADNISDVVGMNLPGCASVEFYSTAELTIEKDSDATELTRVGDVVNYTVTATNTGTADFTAANPAVVVDDLAGVLDDGTRQGDVSASVGGASAGTVDYVEPRISWTGPLAVDETVTITYSIRLDRVGDGIVRNVAFASDCQPGSPGCDPTTPTCDPPSTTCDTETVVLPRLEVEKTASTSTPRVGQTIQYAVVARNVGPGQYTASAPAYVVDDLTGVLDNARLKVGSLSADPAGQLEYSAPRITWTGALAPGESVLITYQVIYTGRGDSEVVNTVFAPPRNPDDPTPACPNDEFVPCDTVALPGPKLTHNKVVKSGPDKIGRNRYRIKYAITVKNRGGGGASYNLRDKLRYGSAVEIINTAVRARPMSVHVDPRWNGRSQTRVTTNQSIGAAAKSGPKTHTFVVTVVFRVAAGKVTARNRDCTLRRGESGTGLLNRSTLTGNGMSATDDACRVSPTPPPPPPSTGFRWR